MPKASGTDDIDQAKTLVRAAVDSMAKNLNLSYRPSKPRDNAEAKLVVSCKPKAMPEVLAALWAVYQEMDKAYMPAHKAVTEEEYLWGKPNAIKCEVLAWRMAAVKCMIEHLVKRKLPMESVVGDMLSGIIDEKKNKYHSSYYWVRDLEDPFISFVSDWQAQNPVPRNWLETCKRVQRKYKGTRNSFEMRLCKQINNILRKHKQVTPDNI